MKVSERLSKETKRLMEGTKDEKEGAEGLAQECREVLKVHYMCV